MDPRYRQSAEVVRAGLSSGHLAPPRFREALEKVPKPERDAWFNEVLGIEEVAEDGVELPSGCTPYLPCSVDAVLNTVDVARISSSDVFVDIGSGVGRAALLVGFLTGASAVGIEVQPNLVEQSRAYARDLNVSGFSAVVGDAERLTREVATGTVFFLYCPFGSARLNGLLDSIAPIAKSHQIRVCTVNLNLPRRPWLQPLEHDHPALRICQSTFHQLAAAER